MKKNFRDFIWGVLKFDLIIYAFSSLSKKTLLTFD